MASWFTRVKRKGNRRGGSPSAVVGTHLSDFGVKLVFVCPDEFVHDFVDLFVRQCFFLVEEGEADGVRLFAGPEPLAFVDIEEGDGFQQVLFGAEGRFPDFLECHLAVEQQGEIALDGWILGHGDVGDPVVAQGAQNLGP